MRTIKCQICGKEVEAKSSRQKYCPECAKEKKLARNKEWRENNKEYSKEYNNEYRGNNKEKIAEKEKEWRKNNKEKVAAKTKKWRENNKEKVAEMQKKWRENNKEHVRAYDKERYQRNREQNLAKSKEWYKNNKEQKLAKSREWYESNKVIADREGNNFCVYIHTDPVGKVYIGRAVGNDVKTVNRQRWGGGTHYRGQKFHDECIAVYGWNNIQHELLEWGLTYEEVIEREKYWIEHYNSRDPKHGYNIV